MASISAILRALSAIPRGIERAMVDEEPILRERIRRDTLSIPGIGGAPGGTSGFAGPVAGVVGLNHEDIPPEPTLSTIDTPTGEVEQAGSRRRPSRLANAIGGFADNFVTAMNAPVRGNAVGTIGQFTNAVGAIRNERERRDMRDRGIERQDRMDAERSQLHQAQMDRYNAQAEEDRAQAEAMKVPIQARLEQFRSAFKSVIGREPTEQELLVQMKLAQPAPAGSDKPMLGGPGSVLFAPSGKILGSAPFAPKAPSTTPFGAMVAAKQSELGRDLTSSELQEISQATKTEPRDPFAMVVAQKEREQGRSLTSQEMMSLQQQFKQSPYGAPSVVIMREGVPTIVPRPEAFGQAAPVTTFDMQGLPSTGGVQGVSRSAPPAISDGTQDQLANLDTSIQQFNEVRQLMNDPKFQTLGPIVGRIKMAEIGKLGGAGATPEQIQMATRLQRLLSQQAFAQGGKALTPTELEQFKAVTPSPTDTVQQAVVKAEEALRFLERAKQSRVNVMSPRQRAQVPGPMGGVASPKAGPKIGDSKTYMGRSYKFDGKQWVLGN